MFNCLSPGIAIQLFHSVVFNSSLYNDEMSSEDDMSDMDDSLLTEEQLAEGKKSGGVPRVKWTKQEDSMLKTLVDQHGEKWDTISKYLKERTDLQCQQRWTKVVNPDLIKGPWTKEVCMRAMCLLTII